MHCPYCQQPVTEELAQCSACGLDLARLDSVLGVPPVIGPGLTDFAGELRGTDARKVERAIRQFEERFPQCGVAVVLQPGPVVVPLRTWTWWLFNRGNFSAALNQGFMNRDLLLCLDPRRRQAALMIGYGLEPFVGFHDLNAALDGIQPALHQQDWAEAAVQVLLSLEACLRTIVGRMSLIYGVPLPMLTESDRLGKEAATVW